MKSKFFFFLHFSPSLPLTLVHVNLFIMCPPFFSLSFFSTPNVWKLKRFFSSLYQNTSTLLSMQGTCKCMPVIDCMLFLSLISFILKQWHALSREEQAKYYELARKERQLHMQLYPGWSARDNYVSINRTDWQRCACVCVYVDLCCLFMSASHELFFKWHTIMTRTLVSSMLMGSICAPFVSA